MKAGNSHARYPFPWKIGIHLLRDSILFRSRSFREDAVKSIQLISPNLKIIQEAYIPKNGPCLLAMNHYSRPGFDAWWIALGISAVIPVEIHWMMTDAWTHAGTLEPITRWLFPRLAQVYGFTTTPPMPPAPHNVDSRVQAVRHVLEAARSPGAVIGLAPEGRDHPGGILSPPPPGVGRFIHQLAKHCQRIVPIGVYEDAEYFCLNFGPSFTLTIPSKFTADERDHHVTQQVMRRIACLLPPHLRGDYDPS